MHRLERSPDNKSLSYNSYTFGDPATPFQQRLRSDPTKLRIMHAGSETFHVYHLHGGGIRWRFNPATDSSFWYGKVGLDKKPKDGTASRLDSQSMGPGESYSLEIEGGAGGVQQTVGDLLEHCHIAEHYVAGMWSFWRVFNTRQPDLAPLPDRAAPPEPVDSRGLIGRTMADGTVITKDNLLDWVKPMLPTPGVPRDRLDAEVWDWRTDTSDPDRPLLLGEQEEDEAWPNLPGVVAGHPCALPATATSATAPRSSSTRSTAGPPTRCCARTSASARPTPPTGTPARRSSATTPTPRRRARRTPSPTARTGSARPARRRGRSTSRRSRSRSRSRRPGA